MKHALWMFVLTFALVALSACSKKCPECKPPKCPECKATKCPPCPAPKAAKPATKAAVQPAADKHHHHGVHKGKRAEHLPVTLPCINRSVIKMVKAGVITKAQQKKFNEMHSKMHDNGMEPLEKQIFALQKKMSVAVINDTWKKAEVAKQLKELAKLRVKAYMLKAQLVRDLLKMLKPEQKKQYLKELEKRVNNIYKGH